MMQAKGLTGSSSPLHNSSKYEHQIVQSLKEKFHNYKAVLNEVMKWTSGQPSLTQQLCHMVVEAKDRPTEGQESVWVEQLVNHQWVSNWERRPELYPMREIRDRLMRRRKHNIQILRQYHRIVHKGTVPDDNTPELDELKHLGLIISDDGAVRIPNRLYSSVFDADWVESALKTIEFSLAPSDVEFRRLLVTLERNLLLSQVNILSQADNDENQRSSQALYEVLRDVTSKIGDLVGADRATIFLINEDKTELWSLVAENDAGDFLDIQVRVGEGISGTVAASKKAIHIGSNVYDDPRAKLVKAFDEKYHYRTRNILALPVLNAEKEVIAVIQFLNKLQSDETVNGGRPSQSFTKVDVERLAKCIVPIRRILESCQSCYKVMKKLRATAALAEATRSIDQINLDTKAILQRVMNTAKKLLNADRSTLWLVDQDRNELWTEIPGKGEVRCTIGVGFAGTVAETREPMLIPFDLYNHPSAENAKKIDEQTHYRTCSLLCMPIVSPEGQLLGVTQLVNKRKAGYFNEYTKDDYPKVPDYFQTSFDKNDQQAMQVFNERVGVVLQFVRTHETLKQLSQAKPKEAIFNALAVLSNSISEQADQSDEALYTGLYYMLTFISQAVGKLLNAEYTTIFLLDGEETGLWTLTEDEGGDATEIRVSATLGISARILRTKAVQVSRNPKKFNDVLIYRGIRHSQIDKLSSLLLYPVLDNRGKVVAIIRCFNKLQSLAESSAVDNHESDTFTKADVEKLSQRTPKVLPILQAFQSFHQEILTIKENRQDEDPLYEAISFVKQSSGNPEELIQNVMQAVKNLTNADRSSLWLLNHDTNTLWTKIRQSNGEWMEASVPMGVGFVGKVAETGLPENIPYDLYDHPDSEMAQKTDEQTRYRTCSLLCMPVLSEDGELLGVTQLVNKRQDGQYPDYDPDTWPEVPFQFMASFEEEDQHNMEVFNAQVGVILPGLLAESDMG